MLNNKFSLFRRFITACIAPLLVLTILHVWPVYAASAVERPQIFWQGKLEGTHDLIVRKTSINVTDVSGPPVIDQAYRFVTPLPGDSVTAEVDPRTSRGYVKILEQPGMGNDYTLRIRIEDRQAGAFLYGIAIAWDSDSPIMSTSGARNSRKPVTVKDASWSLGGHLPKVTCRAIWQGELRGKVRLSISGREARVVKGSASGNLNVMAATVWPKGVYVPVVLATSAETRADIVDLPTKENGYTLTVDLAGDTAQAAIEIAW